MPRRLRVLFVIGTLSGGGAERQVIEVLKHLDRTRFEPILYVGHRRGELLDEVPGDVPVHSFWDGYLRTWKYNLDRVMRRTSLVRWRHLAHLLAKEEIDLVYDRTYLATLDAAEATTIRPTPRLSACVADPETEVLRHSGRAVVNGKQRAAHAYGTASRILANSQGLKQRLTDYLGLPHEQIAVVPNVINMDRIRALMQSPVPDWPSGRFQLLTVGRIDENKGHFDLLNAIEILVKARHQNQIVWHIAGHGEGEPRLRQEIRARGLAPFVDLMGFVQNPFPLYRAANLLCSPSRSEGLPNVILEALACRTPVVSTDCPSGPREILDHGRFGLLVPVRNPAEMADAIETSINNSVSLREQAQVGGEFVERMFSPKLGVSCLEHLMEETVACLPVQKR